jgi:hypothetical protein
MAAPDYLDLPDLDAVFRSALDWDGLGLESTKKSGLRRCDVAWRNG